MNRLTAGARRAFVSAAVVAVTVGSAAGPAVAQPGMWSPTGSMLSGRSVFTLTLLDDGRVLSAGGLATNDGTTTALAEIYNPESRTWSATAPMQTARARHNAIRLPDGRVLVAGGRLSNELSTAEAELYDPDSGTWGATGSLHVPRDDFVAVLLRDGRVLAAGGVTATLHKGSGSNFYTNTAEIYDPASGTWTMIGKMASKRGNHRAVLLADGRVLVTGGFSAAGHCVNLHTAEIYSPATGDWSVTAGMSDPRTLHAAAPLPDGRVLVAGGWSLPPVGCDTPIGEAVSGRSEIYTPSTGKWTASGPLAVPRTAMTQEVLTGGRVLVAGGFLRPPGQGLVITASTEAYDPSSGRWSPTAAMTTPRIAHSMIRLLDGTVLVAGGGTPTGPSSSAEIYTP